MARIRTIKPEFWTDEKLTECSLSARLLFIGTWNFSDDSGNLDRSAKQIKARVFPLDNINCEPLLLELLAQGLLIEYSVNDKLYLHISGFDKHQLINRPSKPTCPPLDTHATLTECSSRKGREGKVQDKPLSEYSDEFLIFWKEYPNKTGKGDAWKSWKKEKPSFSEIMMALSWQNKSDKWLAEGGKFVPMPATYLNGKRWLDEKPTVFNPSQPTRKLCGHEGCKRPFNLETSKGPRCTEHM